MNLNTQELFLSYQSTLSSMGKVYPFSEFEIQPWYNQEWIQFFKTRLTSLKDQQVSLKEIIKQFPNPSELRSMYIMDLIDCGLTSVNPSFVHEFYLPLLEELYPDDVFSLRKTNVHRYINKEQIKDFYFYPFEDSSVYELLSLCFSYAYAKNYDIFAGKTYECLGPFSIRKHYVYTLTIFKELGFIFVHFTKKFNKIEGGIDLFGHSTFLGFDQIAVFDCKENKFIQNIPKDIFLQLKESTKEFIKQDEQRSLQDKVTFMYHQRISRFGNLLGVIPYDFLFEHIKKPTFIKSINPLSLMKNVCFLMNN